MSYQSPPAETIGRIRGNTYPESFTIKRDGVVEDITGRTYALSVYSTSNVLQWTQAGVVADGTTGIVSVTLTSDQANIAAGPYRWRLDQTSVEGSLTVGAGDWIVTTAPPT